MYKVNRICHIKLFNHAENGDYFVRFLDIYIEGTHSYMYTYIGVYIDYKDK